MKHSLLSILIAALMMVGLASTAQASDQDILRSAHALIAQNKHRSALRTLETISHCRAACKYAQAIAHSRLGERDRTRVLAAGLVNDGTASLTLREGAARLLAWAEDGRFYQKTGRRIVQRRDLGGLAMSDDEPCTHDVALVMAWQEQWARLGIDPTQIDPAGGTRLCQIGPPVVEEETYADRCASAGVDAIEEPDDELTQSSDSVLGEMELDGWQIAGEDTLEVNSGPSQIILEGERQPLDCSVFAPPVLEPSDN